MAQRLRSHPLLRLHSLADMERRHALHFRAAELYWVTRDMTRVALDASTDMPPWTPSAVIPVPIGLLIWAEDLPRIVWRGHDNNPMVPIDGVLWEQSGGYVNRRVSIIDLRRQDNHSGATETAAREYKHRWYVRGHWRQQPHGPAHALRRPTWIPGHTKRPRRGTPSRRGMRPRLAALTRGPDEV